MNAKRLILSIQTNIYWTTHTMAPLNKEQLTWAVVHHNWSLWNGYITWASVHARLHAASASKLLPKNI